MDVHDPGDRDTSSDRPESPLPRRAHPAAQRGRPSALFALHPVPSPRTPGDGPLPSRPDGPVPHPRAADTANAIPEAGPAPSPSPETGEQRTADSAPTGPVARMPVWQPADTPPMAWTPVGPPVAAPPRSRSGLRVLESDLDRRVALALAVAVVLVAAAALVLGGFGRSATDPVAAPAGSAAPAGAPDLADGTTVVDAAAFGGAEPSFRSPTGNIDCRMSGDGARCTAENRTWQFPAGVAECPPGVAGGVAVTGSGPAAPSCGDATGAGSARTLDYGSALRSGATTCVSRRDGVECRSAASGHGFAIARSTYRVY